MVTIVPSRPAVNSNKNLYIYYIFIHFYNCWNRTAVEPLVTHRSNRSHLVEFVTTVQANMINVCHSQYIYLPYPTSCTSNDYYLQWSPGGA